MPKKEFCITALHPVLAFGLLGFISGAISMYFGFNYTGRDGTLALYLGNLQAPFFFTVAMVYGLAKFKRTGDVILPYLLFFVTIGWIVANATFVYFITEPTFFKEFFAAWGVFVGFLAAGLIGAFISIFGLRTVLEDVTAPKALWVPVLIGGITGLTSWLLGFPREHLFGNNLSYPGVAGLVEKFLRSPYTVFIAWQAAIGASIGYFYVKNAPKAAKAKKKTKKKKKR